MSKIKLDQIEDIVINTASDTQAGITKLYPDLSSGFTDGAVSQKGVRDALSGTPNTVPTYKTGGNGLESTDFLYVNSTGVGFGTSSITNPITLPQGSLGAVLYALYANNGANTSRLRIVANGTSYEIKSEISGTGAHYGIITSSNGNQFVVSPGQSDSGSLRAIANISQGSANLFATSGTMSGANTVAAIAIRNTINKTGGKAYALYVSPFIQAVNTDGLVLASFGTNSQPVGGAGATHTAIFEVLSNKVISNVAPTAANEVVRLQELTAKVDKVGTTDIEITDPTKGIILRSPNGTRYRITVSDAGVLTTVAI